MYQLLPGLHALTGCDSTSGIFSVGKVKPLKWARLGKMYLQLVLLESLVQQEILHREHKLPVLS